MLQRENSRTRAIQVFEKILLLIVIPLSGIVIPMLFNVFSEIKMPQRLWYYLITILTSYAVWLGCRQVFLLLRFTGKFHLQYKEYIIYYSLFLLFYSFTTVYLVFRFLSKFLPIKANIILIAGLCTFLTILISAVYEIILLFGEKKAEQLNNIILERAKMLTELNSIKTRIEPHFLFNSLNTLQNLIIEDRDLAHRFNKTLADIYQQIITVSDKNFITIHDDLSMMYKYYELITIRFPEATQLHIDITHFDLDARLPPLSLQILLENALKHNRFSKNNPLKIEIDIGRNYISFSNTRSQPPMPDINSTKTGLKILSERFSLLLNKKVEIINDPYIFTVMLPI